MNKQMKIAIFAIIALGTIGFAAITISLRQNGTATISGIESNFTNNIQFETVYVDEQSKTDGATVSIAPDRKSITFTTQTLDTLNEQAVLTYKIKNDSQYNAQLGEMNCSSDDTDYVQITRGGALTNTTIAKGETSAADTITVKLVKTYSETTPKKVTITCDLNATAQSAAA